MEFTPEIKRPLGTMDPRLFRAEPMGLRRLIEDRPLASRFEFDPQREVLFINFAGLTIRSEADLAAIAATVKEVCAPLGRRTGQDGLVRQRAEPLEHRLPVLVSEDPKDQDEPIQGWAVLLQKGR